MKNFGFGRKRLGELAGLFGLVVVFMLTVLPVSAFGADRLVVNNNSGSPTFVVSDIGQVWTSNRYYTQSPSPGFWLDETGAGYKGAFFVLDDNWMQVQRRAQGFGAYEASPFFVNVNAPHAAFYLAANGYLGLAKASPSHPIHMASGAYCTTGGVWTNASSKEYKQDIKELTRDEAMETLNGLSPVKFAYKSDAEEKHVGFIAEDVPELVATKDKKGTSSMDVVAVLTKVVQEQQKTIAELSQKMADLEKELKAKDKVAMATID